ncbi:hypothetical protein ABD83_07320 [Bacillus xiamenensis]|uniref:Immunity protein 30 domain-containing protein n=1 Tax=Bacillus xiamenensis TaxID=1178537 RepID=A0ABT4EWM8_9BACI|nr:hypothetical protein [Bacillus xiamenensis]MBG9911267.1 hypothetical protein [Bacillus xiamenensis]MCY9574229.1 hypothetical protein [Bacillus xiamenensis]
MYIELNKLLSADTTVDSWYDDGCLIASEILSDFSLNDWEELSNQVLNKPIEWQRKIAYCLDNECNEYEFNILMDLLNTNDTELFEICIDTLRSYPIEEGKKIVLQHPQILERINQMLATSANPPAKIVLQDFISKIHSN